MTLSENAVRGKKIVSSMSVICSVISILSIFYFNIIGAILGISSSRYMKRGSIAARDMCMIMRIDDILVLVAALIVSHSFAGENVFKVCLLLAVVIATFDMVILITLTSADAKAYFAEVYEWQQAEEARRTKQTKQSEQVRYTELSEMLRQTELQAVSGQEELSEFSGQAVPYELPEQTGSHDFSGQTLSYEQFRESIVSGSAENENKVLISDEDKLL